MTAKVQVQAQALAWFAFLACGCVARFEPSTVGTAGSAQETTPASDSTPSTAAPDSDSIPSGVSLEWLGGGARTVAVAASEDGSVVVGFTASGLEEGLRWEDGEMRRLGKLDLQGDDRSRARAVSLDGATIVGDASATGERAGILVWRDGAPMEHLALGKDLVSATPVAVSHGGKVVIAFGSTTLRKHQVLRWTNGVLEIVTPPSPGASWAARGASADGSVFAGQIEEGPHSAFVWKDGKTTVLAAFAGERGSSAWAVSPDGDSVVGHSGDQAVLWKDGKVTALGILEGYEVCTARAVSRGGLRIVGTCARRTEPLLPPATFVWDRPSGMRHLGQLLHRAGQLHDPAALTECFGISADGTTIVGNGHSPAQPQEAWKAVLPAG